MKGIQTHRYETDSKALAKLAEFEPALQAIRWIDPDIRSFDLFIERVLDIIESRIPGFTWIGYYWVKPHGLTLIASIGPKEGEHKVVAMRRGAIGRAAAAGSTITGHHRGLFVSEIATPVLKFGIVIGVIAVRSESLRTYEPEHIRFVRDLAELIASRWGGKSPETNR
jgi:putative methionine-R-sulfoxide reductase with GAF domain